MHPDAYLPGRPFVGRHNPGGQVGVLPFRLCLQQDQPTLLDGFRGAMGLCREPAGTHALREDGDPRAGCQHPVSPLLERRDAKQGQQVYQGGASRKIGEDLSLGRFSPDVFVLEHNLSSQNGAAFTNYLQMSPFQFVEIIEYAWFILW